MYLSYDVDLAGLTGNGRLCFLDHMASGPRRALLRMCRVLTDSTRDFDDRFEAVRAVLIEAKRLRNAPQVPMAEEDDDQADLLAIVGQLETMISGIHYLMNLMPEQHDQLQAIYDALEAPKKGAK